MNRKIPVRKNCFDWIFIVFIVSVFSVAAFGQSEHRHQNSGNAPKEWKSLIKVVKIKSLDKTLKRENVARNHLFEAFTVYQESATKYRIFFVERKTKTIYEILGAGQPHREFSDLSWKNQKTLVFDSRSNPHHGAHYEFDVQTRKMKKILIFED